MTPGEFPTPIRIHRRLFWDEDELVAWERDRVRRRDDCHASKKAARVPIASGARAKERWSVLNFLTRLARLRRKREDAGMTIRPRPGAARPRPSKPEVSLQEVRELLATTPRPLKAYETARIVFASRLGGGPPDLHRQRDHRRGGDGRRGARDRLPTSRRGRRVPKPCGWFVSRMFSDWTART